MKILYIITQGHGGGAQKYVLLLARRFSGAVATGVDEDKLMTEAQGAGLETFPIHNLKRSINPFQDLMAAWEIRELIKIYRPDIVHLNSSKAGVLGSFASVFLKTKVVYTAHGLVFNEPLPFWLKTFYMALEKTASVYRSYIIAVSEADRKSALDFGLISSEKISVIHNGIPKISFFSKEEAKQKLNLPLDKFILGSIANAYKTKGLDTLIDSIYLLPEELKTKILVPIIGDGPEFEILQTKITNLKLNQQIKLLGQIKNASELLKAFDAFILPSRKEGFPFTLLEAMQAGLPIIATKVGGNAEGLKDAAILVDPENSKALSEAIQNLIADKNLRQQLNDKSLKQAQNFTEEKMFEETKKVYDKILKA